MATTIDKYVLETSVTGLDQIKATNKEIESLGTNINTVSKQNLSFKINTTGFAALEKSLSNISTAINNISNKTVTPKINTAGLDALNNSIGALIAKIDQGLNFKTDTTGIDRADREVKQLQSDIDKVNRTKINVKSESESFLGTNLRNIGDAFETFKGNVIGGAIAGTAAAVSALAVNTIALGAKLSDLSNASDISASSLLQLRRSVSEAGGETDDYEKIVNKLRGSINDAATGNEKAIQTFKDLNVPIKNVDGTMRSTYDILNDSVKSLGSMDDKMKQTRLSTELFDKSLSNIDWSNVSVTGNVAMDAHIKKADEIDAKWTVIKNNFTEFGVKTIPAVAGFISWLATPIRDTFDLLDNRIKESGGTWETAINNMKKTFATFVNMAAGFRFDPTHAAGYKEPTTGNPLADAGISMAMQGGIALPSGVKGIGSAAIQGVLANGNGAVTAKQVVKYLWQNPKDIVPLLKNYTNANMYQGAGQFAIGGTSAVVGKQVSPYVSSLHAKANDIRSKRDAADALNAASRMKEQARLARQDSPTGVYDVNQFGTPKPKKSGGGGGADDAKREAEAREKARLNSDAQLRNVVALSQITTQNAEAETKLLGLTDRTSKISKERLTIESNLKKDLLKIDEEITKEKEKGSKADAKILTNLETEKVVVTDMAAQLLEQQDIADKKRRTMEDQTKSLSDQYDTIMAIAEIDDKTSKIESIQKEIDKQKALTEQYKGQYDALIATGEEMGLLSDEYLVAAENFSAYNQVWMNAMEAQKTKIEDLKQAEKDRSESFAGGWESAMKRMTEAIKPAQLGAQAFDSLWGNIENTLSNTIATGKFEFTKFRDKVIADIALMASKALASNLIGKILGTAVNAVIPGAGAAIGGDKGGSAFLPKASGGAVGANQPYIVGERGPELFMPGRSGTIVPNSNLGGDTKPQVVNNYTYNVSAVDGQSVARFFMENKNMVAAANSAAKKERS